jgi:drug/metabolite transporter (DMT)-like permease
MSPASTDPRAVLFVLVATLALAFKGIFAKYVYMADMSVDGLLLLRFGIAAPLFWVGVWVLARKSPPLTWAQWKACGFAGFMFFLATYCDFTALSLVGVSISRLVLFTFPMIVMLINAVIFKKAPSLKEWIVFILTYFGIALVMAPSMGHSEDAIDWIDILWAMGSAVTYGIYLVTSQQIMQTLGSVRFTAASGSVTLLFMLMIFPFTSDVSEMEFTTDGVFWSVMIAVFCTVIPFFMLFEGIKRCGANQASLITLSGPVLTVVLAWVLLGETLGPIQLLGAAITIMAVASLKADHVFSWIMIKLGNLRSPPLV